MYQFATEIDEDMQTVLEKVTAALQAEGFGVLTEIDIQATLKKKLGVDRRPYRILGACNPPLANQALEAEPDIGLLLPCNVVVREVSDTSTRVAFMDPEAVLTLVDREDVTALARDVRERLLRVRAALGGTYTEVES